MNLPTAEDPVSFSGEGAFPPSASLLILRIGVPTTNRSESMLTGIELGIESQPLDVMIGVAIRVPDRHGLSGKQSAERQALPHSYCLCIGSGQTCGNAHICIVDAS